MLSARLRKTGATALACLLLISQASAATAQYQVMVPLTRVAVDAPRPEVSFDRDSHDFGIVPLATTAKQVLVLTNRGNASLSLSDPFIEGAGYSVESTTCPATLAIGANCTITIGFKPGEIAKLAGLLSLNAGAAGVQKVELLGTGGASVMRWDNANLDFGPSVANSTYKRSNTLHNIGNTPATIQIEPPASVAATTCGTVPPSGSCVVDFNYTPVADEAISSTPVGVKGATLNENALVLSGSGVAVNESASVDKADVAFGGVGKLAAQTIDVQLTNTGNTALRLPANVASFKNNADLSFTSASACPTTLSPGSSCGVTVKFTPKTIAAYAAELTINAGQAGLKTLPLTGMGTGSIARWGITSLAFGDQVANGTYDLSADLHNDGNVAGTFSVALPAGVTASQCGSVAPGSSCKVKFSYTPVAGQSYNAANVLPSGATEAKNGLTITGKGLAPVTTASLSATSIAFGNVAKGADSKKSVKLQNTGNTTLNLPANVVVSKDDAFKVTDTCETTLKPGASCDIDVQFTAGAIQAYSASLEIDAGEAGKKTASVSATGVGSIATWEVPVVDFGDQVASGSYNKSASVKNTGNVAGDFRVALPAGVTSTQGCSAVAPNASCGFTLTYTPEAGKTYASGNITAPAATENSNAMVVKGVGLAISNGSKLSATTAAFGNVAKSGTSSANVITLTNSGNVPLMLPANVGSATANFTVTDDCGTSLAAGASCTISTVFKPTAIQAYTGTLTVDTGVAGKKTVALNGTGTGSIARWAATTLDFGDQVATGGTYTKTAVVYNDGNVAGNFNLAALPAGMTASACSSVAAGANCTMTFTYTPTAGVSYSSGALSAAAATEKANTLTVTGKGIAVSNGLSLSATTATFGNVAKNGTSSGNVITLTNSGNVPLTLPATVATATANFTVASDCGATLAVAGICKVTTTFKPTAIQDYTGTVTIDGGLAGKKTVALSGTGTGSIARWATPNLYFGEKVVTGATYPYSIVIYNDGNVAGNFNLAALPTGVTASACASVAAGGNCSMTFTYTPTAGVAYNSGALSPAGATEKSNTLTVTGSGVASKSDISLSTTTASFANTAKGGTSAASAITVTNSGNVPLTLPAAFTTPSANFTATHTCGTSLAVGGTCTVSVLFKPTAIQAYTGTLSLDAGLAGKKTVSLSGTGTGSIARWGVTTLDFGDQVALPGTPSKFAVVYNDGNMPGDFALAALPPGMTAETCGSVAPGDGCRVTFFYTPTAGVAYNSGALSVLGASEIANTLTVTGKGVAVANTATLSAATAAFANTTKGGTSAANVITLTNTGNVALTLPANVGSVPAGFAVTDTCGTSLAPAATCTVSTTFKPTAIQAYTGTLTVDTGAAGKKTVALTGTGTGSIARWAVTALDFGDQVATGGTYTKTAVVYNDGNVAGNFNLAALPSGMTASACASVAAGANCTMTFTYTPAAGVAYSSGALSAAAATEKANTLTVTGKGIAVSNTATISAATAAFANTAKGGTSAANVITLTNTGNVALALPANVGTVPAGFAVTDSCGTSLAAGASCTVTTTFKPVAIQAYTGTLSIDAGAAGTKTVALSGTGTGSIARWVAGRGTTVAFGDQIATGGTYTLQAVVFNDGNVAGNFNLPALPAGVTASTCASVAAGGNCTMTFTYTPVAGVSYNSGALKPAGATETPNTVTVTGTGVAVVSDATFAPATLAFGNVNAGASSTAQTVKVTNSGNVPLTLPANNLKTTSADHTVSENCGTTLAVGASCNITATFTPKKTGSIPYNLVVDMGAAGNRTLAMSGTGMGAVVEFSGSPVDFGAVPIGTFVTKTIWAKNVGNVTGNFTYTPPAGITSTQCASVAPGASCVMDVRYTPTVIETLNATISPAGAYSGSLVLRGSSVAGVSAASLTSGATNFGGLDLNASATKDLVLTNTGNLPLTLPSPVSTVSTFGFTTTSTCGTTLAAGANCKVSVTFKPTAIKNYDGTVSVNAGAAGEKTNAVVGFGNGTIARWGSTTIGFGSRIADGSTYTHTALLYNDGTVPGTFTIPALPAGVTASACPTIARNSNCTVTLTYTPVAGVVYNSGELKPTGANQNSNTLTVTGTGVAVSTTSTLSASTAAFPNTAKGGTSVVNVITITNTGNVALTLPANVGTVPAGFTVADSCGTSLAPAATCTVTTTFKPTAIQAYTGTLTVDTGAAGKKTVALSGTGTGSIARWASTTLAFGAVAATGGTYTKTMVVNNDGNVTGNFNLAALPAGMTASACASVAAGGNCTMTFTYTPTTGVAYNSGALSAAAATEKANTLTVTGSGVAPVNAATLSSATAAFASTAKGGTSSVNTIVLTNTGNIPLTLPANVGTAPAGFTVTDSCGTSLAAGATCNVTTTFKPTAIQAYTGTMTVDTGAAGKKAVALSGTGTGSIARWSATTVAFGSQLATGGTYTKTAVVYNDGNVAGNFNLPALPAGVTASTCASVAAGGNCTMTFTYTPTGGATYNSGALKPAAATETPNTVTVTGTGVAPVYTVSFAGVLNNFGTLGTGRSASSTGTLRNTGNAPLTLPANVGTAPAGFTVTDTCGTTLAAGAFCDVTVSFAPTAYQNYSGTVSLNVGAAPKYNHSVSGVGSFATANEVRPSRGYAGNIDMFNLKDYGVQLAVGVNESEVSFEITTPTWYVMAMPEPGSLGVQVMYPYELPTNVREESVEYVLTYRGMTARGTLVFSW